MKMDTLVFHGTGSELINQNTNYIDSGYNRGRNSRKKGVAPGSVINNLWSTPADTDSAGTTETTHIFDMFSENFTTIPLLIHKIILKLHEKIVEQFLKEEHNQGQ